MDQLPPKLQSYAKQADLELQKLQFMNDIESKTNIPKLYVAAGISSVAAVLIFMNIFGSLLSSLIGFVFPAYLSFKALKSKEIGSDEQWLTYWIVFAFFNVLECFSDILLFWMPFYYLLKTVIILYLALPQTKGAAFVYSRFLYPIFIAEERIIDNKFEEFRNRATGVAKEAMADSTKQK